MRLTRCIFVGTMDISWAWCESAQSIGGVICRLEGTCTAVFSPEPTACGSHQGSRSPDTQEEALVDNGVLGRRHMASAIVSLKTGAVTEQMRVSSCYSS